MVGFDPEGKALPQSYYGIAGALSGIVTRAASQPIDVLKIRFQLQVEPIKKGSKYSGIYQAFRIILREEGIQAFWKGHIPAQALSINYGIVQFTTFEFLTQQVWSQLPHSLTIEYRPITHTVCGGIAGCLATLAVQPFDVLRTRFVAQGEPKVYTSIQHACTSIVKEEGARGLYRGLLPTLIQIAPYSGLQFGFYALFNAVWNSLLSGTKPNTKPNPIESLVTGGLAGLGSKTAIYPLDMVKKRLQVQGFQHGRAASFGETAVYRGLVDCIRSVVKKEGVQGLYKGLSPSLLKAGVVASISFSVYEQVVSLFEYLYKK